MSEPGWLRFLTEGDRGRVGSGVKRQPFGLGRRPCLLVVDVYREALGTRADADDLDRWPMSCGSGAWEVVDRIALLIGEFRARGLPVVHATGPERLFTRWGHPDDRKLDFGIVPEVAPLEGELVIEKSAPSAFRGTPLAFHLIGMAVDTVIVCGEATSGCVRATVVDAATHRFSVGVVEDCCFDRTEASHWVNLFDMEQKYADVMSTSALIPYLDTTVEDRELAHGRER